VVAKIKKAILKIKNVHECVLGHFLQDVQRNGAEQKAKRCEFFQFLCGFTPVFFVDALLKPTLKDAL
jgi:hypothetical protein